MKNNLLFEIGTEEIPARLINKTLEQLEAISRNKFKENRISHGQVEVFATPRRLVLFVHDMEDKQENLEKEIKGPSKKAAYDEAGNPSKALQGFLRGNGFGEKDIFIKELSSTEYIHGRKFVKGEDTREILKIVLIEILTAINFPKSMKWGGKSFRFVRPVRWLLPIFGDQLIELHKDDIPCTRNTRGHRVLSEGLIEISNTSEYFEKLRKAYVIVDQNERREIIKKQCKEIAEDLNGEIVKDDELLEEIVYLVEYPTAFYGSFSKDNLSLPREAIITPMKEHQRYFPLEDKKGGLMNYFIAVRNGGKDYIDIVRHGNEKVLRARLSDARFFFNEDKKNSLDEYVLRLKDVVFQEALGTVYDKTERIKKIADFVSGKIAFKENELLKRAAHLCKADLVTNMVKEFDELQGIMGREYAIIEGERIEVAEGIKEHYMPRFAGDDLPYSEIGSILSISDKIDTISGCFSIDIHPTGSQDPYALRRQALGIINIIQENRLHIDLYKLLSQSVGLFSERGILKEEESKVISDIIEFFKGRFKNALLDKGYDYYIIDSVLNVGLRDLYDAYLRIQELSKWKDKEGFEDIVSSFNRVSSLAMKCESIAIDKDLLEENEEKNLLGLYGDVKQRFLNAIKERDYNEALNILSSMKTAIDDFFDNVMVMVDDDALRNNRLSIIKSISIMMNEFADLGLIIIPKPKENK